MEECKVSFRVWYLNLLFLFVLLSAVAVAAKTRRVFWGVVLLAIPTVLVDWSTLLSMSKWVYLVNTTFTIIFFGVICGIIMWDVMISKQVTGDTIAGSICAYLLLGLVWAMIYELIELLSPGSFNIPGDLVTAEGSGHSVGFLSFAYFSFTTMTTLGYGDVTPLSKVAQAFAPMQAVFGQLYIAILVARLVAMRVARRVGRGKEE